MCHIKFFFLLLVAGIFYQFIVKFSYILMVLIWERYYCMTTSFVQFKCVSVLFHFTLAELLSQMCGNNFVQSSLCAMYLANTSHRLSLIYCCSNTCSDRKEE